MKLLIKVVSTQNDVMNNLVEYYARKIGTNSTDSGLDICLPCDVIIPKNTMSFKIPLGIACQPSFNDNTIHGYYLYPRSSTGSKTPLRLSNGTGIIDYEYRGEITACVDNNSNTDYVAQKGQRLFQICSHDLSPIELSVVSEINSTSRQCGGYGSTGA